MAGGFIGKGALDLDGTDYAALGDGMATQTAVTLEAWVNPSEAPHENTMLGAGGSGRSGILSSNTPNKFRIKHETVDSSYTDVDYNWVVDKWQHMCFTWDGSTGKAYADGKLLHEWALSGDPYDLTKGAIGSLETGSASWPWEGKIARGSFWKAALTEAEIREMMFYDWADVSGSSIDQTDCVAWYEFSDLQNATTVSDMSGSGNTGTLSSTDDWAGNGTFIQDTSTLQFSGVSGTLHFLDYYHTASVYNMTVDENNHLIYESMEGNWKVLNSTGDFIINGRLDYGSGYGGLTTQAGYMGTAGGNQTMTLGPNANIENMSWYWNSDASPPATDIDTDARWNSLIFRNTGDMTITGNMAAKDRFEINSTGSVNTNGYDVVGRELQMSKSGSYILGAGSDIFFNYFSNTDGFTTYGNSSVTASGEAALQIRADEQPESGCLLVGNGTPEPAGTSPVFHTGNTVSMWVNPKNFDNNYGFFGFGSNKSYLNMLNSDKQRALRGETNIDDDMINVDAGSNVFTAGTWTHVGLVWNADKTWTLYIDGVSKDTSVATTGDELNVSYFGRGYGETTDWDGSIADCRIFRSVLTSGNMATLASVNPATSVSGGYADPDNDLDAAGWWKLGADAVGAADLTNYGTSGATWAGSTDGAKKSGFVTISGTAGFGALNNNYEDMTLTNTYISGMADIVVGEYNNRGVITANTDATLITKGTVVLD